MIQGFWAWSNAGHRVARVHPLVFTLSSFSVYARVGSLLMVVQALDSYLWVGGRGYGGLFGYRALSRAIED